MIFPHLFILYLTKMCKNLARKKLLFFKINLNTDLLVFFIFIVMLMFPTMSFYNLSSIPLLRVDFMAQLFLLSYLSLLKKVIIKRVNLLGFFLLFWYV